MAMLKLIDGGFLAYRSSDKELMGHFWLHHTGEFYTFVRADKRVSLLEGDMLSLQRSFTQLNRDLQLKRQLYDSLPIPAQMLCGQFNHLRNMLTQDEFRKVLKIFNETDGTENEPKNSEEENSIFRMGMCCCRECRAVFDLNTANISSTPRGGIWYYCPKCNQRNRKDWAIDRFKETK